MDIKLDIFMDDVLPDFSCKSELHEDIYEAEA